MGIVEELGSGVTLLKKGDRIVLPFNVADGRCRNCEEGKTAFCTGVNPGFAGGAYGYVAMGPYQGGQAQYLRVPYADFNALKLPPGGEHEADFALLADIFPTGWHGLVLSGFKPGESVAIFGAGPVGLMAAYSGIIRGASKVFVVDQVKERLDAAKKIGCIPINFTQGDPVEQIIKQNGGMVDRAVDAVGYQAVDKGGKKEQPNVVLDQLSMMSSFDRVLSALLILSQSWSPVRQVVSASQACTSPPTLVRPMSRAAKARSCCPSASCSRRVSPSAPDSATSRRTTDTCGT